MGKKNFIGLSILLLVLLLGLFTTCYADNTRTWDDVMIKNLIYNYSRNVNSLTDTQAKEVVNNAETFIDTCLDYVNEYEVVMFYFVPTANRLACSYSNSGGKVYLYENRISSTDSQSWNTIIYDFDDYTTTEQTRLYDLWSLNRDWGVFDKNVFESSNSNTIIYPTGTVIPSVSILESPYTSDFFDYLYNSSLDNLTVPKVLDTIKSMSYSQFRTEYVAEIGMVKFLDYVSVGQFYWDNSISDWKLLRSSNNYIVNNDTTSENFLEVYCPQNWWYGNTLLAFEAISKFDADVGGVLDFWVYLTDNNTVINNGVLNVGSFSGDYDNNIENDIQHDQTIDSINDIKDTITDSSQVDSILGDFSSGDIAGTMGYTEHSLPNVPDERNPSLLLMNLINDFCDILIDDDDPYWDYSMHGETPTRIYASDFTTENTPLKTFISLSMIFGSMFLIYIQFKHIIELINEGNAPKVLHDIDADMYFYKM